jgi:hypothetical protein
MNYISTAFATIAAILLAYPVVTLIILVIAIFASGYGTRALISHARRRRAGVSSYDYDPTLVPWMPEKPTDQKKASIWPVSCVAKNDRTDPHERITKIGGIAKDGSSWKISAAIAIEGLESGKWKFYVNQGSRNLWLVIAMRNGRKYLKTETDGHQPDTLLNLPSCQ